MQDWLRLGVAVPQPMPADGVSSSLTLHGWLQVPPALNGFPSQALIEGGQADEPVDDSANGGNLSELHAENCGNQIEASHSDKSPIEGTDDDQNRSNDIEFLHDQFLPCFL
jgi:hypothetical protein